MNYNEQLDVLVDALENKIVSKNYWVIRTNSGDYFEQFVKNGYVGLTYDFFPLDYLNEIIKVEQNSPAQVKKRIRVIVKKRFELLKEKNPRINIKERTIGLVTSQIYRFAADIKDGDIIIIPSYGSHQICIGTAIGSGISRLPDTFRDKTKPVSRLVRKVKWKKLIRNSEFEPSFFKLLFSHQAITNVSEYGNVVERSITDFYDTHNHSHFVLKIQQQEDINAKILFEFGSTLFELLDRVSAHFELGISSHDFSIQINLNSPGSADFKTKVKKTSIVALIIVGICGGGLTYNEKLTIKTDGIPGLVRAFSEYLNEKQNRELKEKLFNQYMDSLRVKHPEDFIRLMKQFSDNKDLAK